MKTIYVIALLLSVVACPALAVPFGGRVSAGYIPTPNPIGQWQGDIVAGGEISLELQDVPWGFGGLVVGTLYSPTDTRQTQTGWVSFRPLISDKHTVTILAGINHFYERTRLAQINSSQVVDSNGHTSQVSDGTGMVVGFSFEDSWNWFRLRVTPNLTIFPNQGNSEIGFAKSGIPIVELGALVAPNLEVSLCLSSGLPLKASYVF